MLKGTIRKGDEAMRYALLLLQVVVLQACAAANTCGDSGSQFQMTRCAQENLKALELELQKKHERLSDALDDNQFEAATLAWKSYRDAHCASTSNIYAGGSLEKYVLVECKVELTRRRLKSLDEDYQDSLNIIMQGSP